MMSTERVKIALRRGIMVLIAVSLLVTTLGAAAVTVHASEVADTHVTRIYGATRYQTALNSADEVLSTIDGEQFETVIVASGLDFADALAGSYLAVVKQAPILLTNGKNTSQLHEYIRRNLEPGGTVYILGGEKAVSRAVGEGLDGYRVDRLSGATRFETNLKILQEAGASGGEILVCTGYDFADSLSASAVGKPILLVNTQKGTLTQSQKDYMKDFAAEKLCILGGTNAVSTRLESQLEAFGEVERIGGKTRYETSVLVAERFFDDPRTAVLTYALDYPDGLCGGLMAHLWNGPMILTRNQNRETAKVYVQGNGIRDGAVLGGDRLISDDTVRYIFGTVHREPEQPETYSISYELNDGENDPQNPAEYTAGEAVALAAPTREHYSFCGWYLEGTFKTKVETVSAETSGDITLHAKWEPKAYDITYVLNGGTNSGENPTTYTYGDTIQLKDPVKGTSVFGGWYTDSSFRTKIEAITPETSGNLTLYAKWQAESYTITYELNGGRNSSRNPETYEAGDSFLLQGASKSYNTFDGWYLESTFGTQVTQIKATDTGDIKLYAKWSPYTYTITYELNKGENSGNNPTEYAYGDTIKLEDPTRENHTFKGWYLESTFKTRVEEISATTVGNIKLYAKWDLAQLNVSGQGMENMIWTWWYYPQVVSTEDAVYWGYATNEGYCGVAQYDIASGKTTTTHLKKLTAVDDHNGLAVAVLEDGRIMCVYAGGHDSNNEMHIRISGKPGSIENFDTNIVLDSAGKTCYAQIIQYNGRVYIFHRVNSKSWAYRSSEDGINWSDEVIFVSATMQYYCKVMPTTRDGLVRVCMYSNPTAGDCRIRMGFLDLDTGVLYNSDGKTALGTKKVSHESFDILIDQPEGKVQRMFDVAITAPEEPRILYTTFSNSKTANDSIYYLYDSGKTVEICNGGVPLWNPKYQGGASFAGPDCVVLARNENSKDLVEVYDYAQGVITLRDTVWSENVGSGSFRSARPIVDVNGKYFLWHRGYYNPNSYKDFDTDAMISELK